MSVGELLWYNFSLNLWVVHLAVKGFDFITIAFLLPSCDFFVDVGYQFGRFQCLYFFVNGHSAVSCDFDLFIRRGQLFLLLYNCVSLPLLFSLDSYFLCMGMNTRLAVVFLFAT